jgi:L-alanine-DL-glutamate epimerase-like enolase superfamily enzyme
VKCELIEQPFHRENHQRHHDLRALKILPVIADEGIQTIEDYKEYGDCYNGVNVKVLKCGGIDRAQILANTIKNDTKLLIIGCMSESSCGCATAIQLSGYADYLDTDGPFLIKNDPFNGLYIDHHKFVLNESLGTGVNCTPDFF